MLSGKHSTASLAEDRTAYVLLPELNPDKALIFRIMHRDNLPWILQHGLHCRRSSTRDPNFVPIGLTDLIDKRHLQVVRVPPGGTLSNYVPFYFTPLSMMALRIKSGRGVRQRDNREIVIAVTSLRKLSKNKSVFLFTDKHASLAGARFSDDLTHLDRIDWNILQNRNFSRDNEDMGKTDRYQAEALVHNVVPIESLLGFAVYDTDTEAWLNNLAARNEPSVKVIRKAGWYF